MGTSLKTRSKGKMKIEAVPVKVRRDVYDNVKNYSVQTGVPAAQVIAEALTDWLESVGIARLEALSAVELKVITKSNVIEFPAANAATNTMN